MPPLIITQYDYKNFQKPGIDFPIDDPLSRSKAVQSDMDAADINKIMARYEKTGVIIDPQGIERKPMFGDFTQFQNYHAMLSAVRDADRYFLTLPAPLRNRFDNDVQKFVEFCENPANKAELIKLGLREPDKGTYTDVDGNPVNEDGSTMSATERAAARASISSNRKAAASAEAAAAATAAKENK